MVFCTKCELAVSGGIGGLKKHLKEERHIPPFFCAEGNCNMLRYEVKSSWIRHLESHHSGQESDSADSSSDSADASDKTFLSSEKTQAGPVVTEASGRGDVVEPMEVDSDPAETGTEQPHQNFKEQLEKAAALLVMRLKRRGNVPGVAISLMMEEAGKLMKNVLEVTVDQISEQLKKHNVDGEIIADCVGSVQFHDPFAKVRDPNSQIEYFKNNFGLVKSTPIPLEPRWDDKFDKALGMTVPVQVPVSFQYVSTIKILSAVLNNPILNKLIHCERPSTDGHLRSYLDGSLAKSHPLISKYPFTLRINKWMDDSEVVNPLGSKTSIQKIVTDAFVIQNLPPSENARLRSIFVSSYSYREDLPYNRGVDALLDPFFYEMEQLESEEGVAIIVNGEPYTLRATVISGSADSLAAHEMLGLGSPSSNRFCSQCLVSRNEFHRDIFAMGVLRNKDIHQQNLEELRSKGIDYAMRSAGLKRESKFVSSSKHAEFPEAMIKDPMHDILRGIAPMEIKLVLHELCVVKKYFQIEDFNASLSSFNYGPADIKNKPSPNFTLHSVTKPFSYVLHQSAAQTWCLLRIFPFIMASLMPDVLSCHVKLLVLLKRLSDIVFSTDVTMGDLELLNQLIKEHHNLFITLYPPPESDPILEEKEADEDYDEDFLEEEEEEEALVDDPPPGDNVAPCSSQTALNDNTNKKKKKKKMIIRALQKHHHLLHYVCLTMKYGPIGLYSCMRFEAKNALSKRFGAICNNFKNLPVTFANLHQTAQAADWLDLKCSVEEEKVFPRGKLQVARTLECFEALSVLDVEAEQVLQEVPHATVGGFKFIAGLYVTLPLSLNSQPIFGKIRHIFILNEEVYIVTKDVKTVEYSTKFGSYLIEDEVRDQEIIRAFVSSKLPPVRPMTAWTANGVEFYLSPRNAIAELIVTMGRNIDD